ncbi:hypothetical protein HCA61_11170 [Rhodococcus sp. HNM0563]|uniref:hypothetical protein n=1 Tax=unclassified Rhodococcus (in: high G+C Gram-positive bacteria) TaxID=192944 RepID=UPI00146C5690|nr:MULTISPECIES: hypothetical protein [unclassified Rhodococcus (in: high G+C Gram-positive bacteria)]MCK0089298.1 hypothetical protein [Rhodococcus sp. F64268]NLU62826.1 hypothetical protein [Rhodococcus sp. HNM0563]
MSRLTCWTNRQKLSLDLAVRALRTWGPRQMITAAVAATSVGAVVGVATVLIPNPVFTREIPPVPWNYPAWLVTSILAGILIATYVHPVGSAPDEHAPEHATGNKGSDRSSGRLGGAAGVLAWFAVGCPVCNKIALLALGYTGALTWFAPLQPVLAITALVLSALAVLWRLRGQVACPIPTTEKVATS